MDPPLVRGQSGLKKGELATSKPYRKADLQIIARKDHGLIVPITRKEKDSS